MENERQRIVMVRKNIEKRQWDEVRKDLKMCPTILHHALFEHWDNVVFEKLLECGAAVNERNDLDATPLQVALTFKYNAKLIEMLLDHGASVNISSERLGIPLQLAIMNNYSAHIVEKLLQRGASVNDINFFGMNALSMALKSKNYNIAVVEKLLQYGSEVKEIDYDDCPIYDFLIYEDYPFVPPLTLAVQSNLKKNVIKLLLKYNASPGHSLNQILLQLKESDEYVLPYCINLLIQLAAIEHFENGQTIFLGMFDGIRNVQYLDFANRCLAELLHMKELLIEEINNFTLYEFLISKDEHIAPLRENRIVINCVFALLISGKFPLYKDMILSQLGRRALENILLDTVSLRSKYSLCSWDSWLVISKHLRKIDMLHLILALRN